MEQRRRKKYEAEIARKTGTSELVPGSEDVASSVNTSPPVKRARVGRCKVLQTSPPGDVAGNAAMQPTIRLERSGELESAAKATARYGLRPRMPVPEVPANLFAELKEARKRKKARGTD
jgi:hypothetical protein